jgi:hypothetical protein
LDFICAHCRAAFAYSIQRCFIHTGHEEDGVFENPRSTDSRLGRCGRFETAGALLQPVFGNVQSPDAGIFGRCHEPIGLTMEASSLENVRGATSRPSQREFRAVLEQSHFHSLEL